MFSRLMTGVFKGRSYDPFVWSMDFDLRLKSKGPVGVWVFLNAKELVHKKFYKVKKGEPLNVSFSYTSRQDGFIVYNSVNVLAREGVEFTVRRLALTKKRREG